MTDPSPRDHLRAVLIGAILLTHGLIALPIGPKVTADDIATPRAQREIDGWMRLAGPLGFTRDGFEAWVVEWSDWLVETDRVTIRPLTRVFKRIGMGQAWALFATPTDTPRQLEVITTGDDGRQVRFRRHEVDDPTIGPVLRYRRIRGIYDRGKRTRSYRVLTEDLADRLFAVDPTIDRVTVQQRKRRVGGPGEDVPDEVSTELRYSHRRPSSDGDR